MSLIRYIDFSGYTLLAVREVMIPAGPPPITTTLTFTFAFFLKNFYYSFQEEGYENHGIGLILAEVDAQIKLTGT
jgi:hypothetical protein